MFLGGEDMYCRKCGKEITDESKYCQFCGALQETDETTGADAVKKSTEQTINEMKEQIVHGQETGKLYLIIGWISMVVSLAFIPVVFGAVAVIMEYIIHFFPWNLDIFASISRMVKLKTIITYHDLPVICQTRKRSSINYQVYFCID